MVKFIPSPTFFASAAFTIEVRKDEIISDEYHPVLREAIKLGQTESDHTTTTFYILQGKLFILREEKKN